MSDKDASMIIVCVCLYVHAHLYKPSRPWGRVELCLFLMVYTHKYLFVCMHTYMRAYIHTHASSYHLHIHICMHTYMRTFIHINTYTYIYRLDQNGQRLGLMEYHVSNIYIYIYIVKCAIELSNHKYIYALTCMYT